MARIPSPKLELFTPAKARTALKKMHPDQRTIRPNAVSKYYDLIIRNEWYPEIATPAMMDVNGFWINGGHRFNAIAKLSDDHAPVPLMVLRNVTAEALIHIDTGAARLLADQLGYAVPGLKHGKTIASIIPLAMAYVPPAALRVDVKPNVNDAVDFTQKYQERLEESARIAQTVANADGPNGKHAARIVTPRTLGWLLFETIEAPGLAAEKFWLDYAGGEYHASSDPRGQMVRYFRKNPDLLPSGAMSREQTMRRAAAQTACWNAFVTGRVWRMWNGDSATFPHPITEQQPR